jgi:glucose/arabinose dehydrogenase
LFYSGGVARLDDIHVIWRQTKIVSEGIGGEPGGAIVISPDFKYLFISAGDRQEFTPVQQLSNTVGKIVRIGLDGSIPTDNPFTTTADAAPEIWTLGHRNAYGLAFDANGELWEHEMGPLGGDEFNLLEPGGNYGWPNVSWGDNYDGTPITKPSPNDGYVAPAYYWTPAIAPAGMFFYHGGPFAAWNGEAILGGLQSHGIVRVAVDGKTASEVGRIALGARIRDVTEGPDGNIWVLEDTPTGRVIRLTPVYG